MSKAKALCVQQLQHPEGPFRTAVKSVLSSMVFFGLHKSLQHINTHVPSSVQHAAQRHFFLFSSLLLAPISPAGWPNSFWQAEGFSCSSVSVCECVLSPLSPSGWDVHAAQKSRDTQEPLQCDRLPLFVQTGEGLHMRSELLRPSMRVRANVGSAFGSTPRGPVNSRLWDWLCFTWNLLVF